MQKAIINSSVTQESLDQVYRGPKEDLSALKFPNFILAVAGLTSFLSVTAAPSAARIKSGDTPALSDTLQINYIAPAHYYVGSDVSVGFGNYSSDNLPYRVEPDTFAGSLENQLLRVVAQTSEAGIQVAIVNASMAPIYFSAQDSRIELVQQALSLDGTWHDIEYIGQSWCGNSYHRMALPPQQGWLLTAPVYVGEYPTQIRFKLTSFGSESKNADGPLYSNSFPGSVNFGQFYFTSGEAYLEKLIR